METGRRMCRSTGDVELSLRGDGLWSVAAVDARKPICYKKRFRALIWFLGNYMRALIPQ